MEKYSKNLGYSYSYGAFSTIELIKNKPEYVREVHYSKNTNNELINKIKKICSKKNINLIQSDLDFVKITDKKNTFIIGVFDKYKSEISEGKHIVLVSPTDHGNFGTIIRTALGYDFKDIVVIKPQIEIFNPKVIRASMGSIFSINISIFDNLDSYLKEYGNRDIFTFYPHSETKLKEIKKPSETFSLVFSNEKSDLDPIYRKTTKPLSIKTNKVIESLDITITVSLALNHFK